MARYTSLSRWPFILFGIIEPILLAWAYVNVLRSPAQYFADQAPNRPLATSGFSPQAESLTLQMGNVLLLLAAMAVICCWTPHSSISFWYLVAVAFADLGHIYASYRGVGHKYFCNPGQWNAMMNGNVGVSAFLHVNRVATVLGIFGKLEDEVSAEKKSS